MKLKLIVLFMVSALLISGCSSGKPAETTAPDSQPKEITEETDDGIEVEKELFDVTITVPADFIGETTQEALDTDAAEGGYKVTLNDDGSVTFVMTKSQHKEMMSGMAEGINEALEEMIGSEEYPNFTGIEANSDFTALSR